LETPEESRGELVGVAKFSDGSRPRPRVKRRNNR
jgi:hypothetical protein